MSDEVRTSSFEEELRTRGCLVYKTKGVSMRPMLRENRDIIVIRVPEGRLRPMDVALYRRGSQYVLHRVIEVLPDGYLIRGDNTYRDERVTEDRILEVLASFRRSGKEIPVTDPAYLRYVRLWTAAYPLRKELITLRGGLGRLKRKLTGK